MNLSDLEQNLYLCYYTQCSRVCSSKYNLRRHVNSTHLQIRSFKCERCDKRFTSKQILKEHFYIHTDEKPFTCVEDDCNKSFRQASQLNVHRKKVHMMTSFSTVKRSEAKATIPVDFDTEPSEMINFSLNQQDLPEVQETRMKIQTFKKLPVLPILLNNLKGSSSILIETIGGL